MKEIRQGVKLIYERLSEASRNPTTYISPDDTSSADIPLPKPSRTSPATNPARNHVDAHIAALVPQNFTAAVYALSEARRRLGPSWRPNRILDIGTGPAVGVLALNEVFEGSTSYNPEHVQSVIYGNKLMARRGMEILRAQKLEQAARVVKSFQVREHEKLELDDEENEKVPLAFADEEHFDDPAYHPHPDSIDTRFDGVKFRLNSLPTEKYDLITVMHHMLFPTEKKPGESDRRLKRILDLLAPGGVLVLIERGNLLGFERIARAREMILRPKTKRTVGIKEDSLRKYHDQQVKNFPEEGFSKEYTTPAQATHAIEFEPLPEDQITQEVIISEKELHKLLEPENKTLSHSRSSLRVIAPCSHHNHCPLQLRHLDEDFKRRSWCHFPQMMQKPDWLIDLKRGKNLSLSWKTSTKKLNKPNKMSGKGRTGSRNYELAQISYLVVQKEAETAENTLPKPNSTLEKSLSWPRILNPPIKRDKHVMMDVCSPQGFFERWTITKSSDKQQYHDARKANWGDLWALQAKLKVPREVLYSSGDSEGHYERKVREQQEQEDLPQGLKQSFPQRKKVKMPTARDIKKEQKARSHKEFQRDLERRHHDLGLSRSIILKSDPDYDDLVEKYGEQVTDEYWRKFYHF